MPGCDSAAPSWSVLCDLHRDRLRAGVRLTDGAPLPRKPSKPSNNIVFGRRRATAPAAPTDDERHACELRRAIEEREERRRLARELEGW